MLMAAYSALLGLGLLVSAPWWLLRMATTARYRQGLSERLGRVPHRLRASVRNRRVLWVHAVSVGEVLAVSRLVSELAAALEAKLEPAPNDAPSGSAAALAAVEPAWQVVLSTTTRTGQALARERFGADQVFYFPLDFRWAVGAYLRALKPELVLLAESELWPRLLHECRRAFIPVAVVNARVSDRSFRRARRLRSLWRPVLRNVTKFFAQSEADAARLRFLGASPEAVTAVGNLKYDAREPRPSPLVEALRTVCAGRPVLVAGSTVEREDELVLSSFYDLRQAVPDTLLILAPRHPERFSAVTALAGDLEALRASSLLAAVPKTPPAPAQASASAPVPAARSPDLAPDASVIVLDTIGDLPAVYGLADVVFIGGSLVARGGHNPLEPARFGVPVIMGPSFENFRAVVAAMQATDGIRIVKDEEELTSTLVDLLTNFEQAHTLGERGQIVFRREGGATARCIQSLMPLLAISDLPRQRVPRAKAASREVSA